MLFKSVTVLTILQGLAILFEPVSGSLTCGSKPTSCGLLPKASKVACDSIIHKSKIVPATCTPVNKKVVTKYITPTKTVKAVVTSVKTVSVVPGLPRITTVVIDTTSIATVVTTETVEEAAVVTSTSFTEVTTTTWVDERSICTSIPWPDQKRDVNKRYNKKENIPKDCSCFLTKTTTSKCSTSTKSITRPCITKTSTSTQKKTVTVTLTPKDSTIISSSTIIETITTPFISTTTSTSTTTITATSTKAVEYDSCAPENLNEYNLLSGRNAFFYHRGSQTSVTTQPNTSECCRLCGRTTGCTSYIYNTDDSSCKVFTVDQREVYGKCISEKCPYGFASGYFAEEPDDNLSNQYGFGRCGGVVTR